MIYSLVYRAKNNIIKGYGWLILLLKIGCIGFGGGNALIPVIEEEVVNNYKLISKKEFDEYVIVASVTPGSLTVKIAAAIGKKVCGTKGMFFAALCMGAPGFVATVLMISIWSKLTDSILKQVQIISIGITAFILAGLFQYIGKSINERKESGNFIKTIAIILIVFFLSCEKNIYTILNINKVPIFGVSAINILIISFFLIFYMNNRYTFFKCISSFIISGTYLLCVKASKIIYSNYIFNILKVIMIILSCYESMQSTERKKFFISKIDKKFITEIRSWIMLFVIVSLIAMIMSVNAFEFIVNGFLSCIISFGGGDAYLTIADGMFVSNGMISYDEFYGNLIIIINILPGSILCKVLSGIGYYIGFEKSNSIFGGYTLAFLGFICSIITSCGIFSFGNYILSKFNNMKAFIILKRWIRIIISGLLANVVLSLLYQCMKVAFIYNLNPIWIIAELFFLYIINNYLNKFKKNDVGFRIGIISIISIALGNLLFNCKIL
ncbi:chromate transporter [Clostridium butyricum]|uniref:chromate transporter n=1 Tax=Clostridium butyricum TaxID=1492 RepID=UPI0034670F90